MVQYRPNHATDFPWVTYDNGAYLVSNDLPKVGNVQRNDSGMKLDKNKGWVAVPKTTLDCRLFRFDMSLDREGVQKWIDEYPAVVRQDRDEFLEGLGAAAFTVRGDMTSDIKGVSAGGMFGQFYSTTVAHLISQSFITPTKTDVYYLRIVGVQLARFPCGNVIAYQDLLDERHVLLRPIQSCSTEEFYDAIQDATTKCRDYPVEMFEVNKNERKATRITLSEWK